MSNTYSHMQDPNSLSVRLNKLTDDFYKQYMYEVHFQQMEDRLYQRLSKELQQYMTLQIDNNTSKPIKELNNLIDSIGKKAIFRYPKRKKPWEIFLASTTENKTNNGEQPKRYPALGTVQLWTVPIFLYLRAVLELEAKEIGCFQHLSNLFQLLH